ncbi:MAG: HAD-IIIA family hydrolase [Blautia sp.]|nr:HAD-IIIA family hydrolase [Lachnoclostridium sp.]MCM1212444.1 HAD-IIIA family hydrolase [Blautia sp.]
MVVDMIDTVIFDLDGTLLDTLEDLADSVNAALEQFQLPARTIGEIRNFVGNGVARLIERVVPDGKENPFYEKILCAFKEHYGQHCKDKTKPYDGVMDMLDDLCEKGYKLAIVSNKFDTAVKELSGLYFGRRILASIGESESVRKKPAPDTVYQALKELSADAGTVIYVGDSEVDIETAANAGIPCISVTWGFRSEECLLAAGADKERMITAPSQLLPLLLSLSQVS